MKKQLTVLLGILLTFSASAQVVFTVSSLPSLIGDYNCSYYSTNSLNVMTMLNLNTNNSPILPDPKGEVSNSIPQIWNFSQLEQTNESVLRTDIISPANGPDGGDFPAAAYAEQDTLEPDNQIAWRYYSITNQGRYYYGYYDPPNADADSLVQFDQSTIDVPATVQYGQTWTRSVAWTGLVDYFFEIDYQFTAAATVDAYGTLMLPGIGNVPALRVHETHIYQASEEIDGEDPVPVDLNTNQYYYWLVPNIGVAVQIFEFGDNVLYPTGLPATNSVERMFYTSYYTNPPIYNPPVQVNLHIQLQNESVLLNWASFSNSSSYQVQASGSLASTNWQSIGLTTNNSWSDTLSTTQRFYRVVGSP
jgi:hypothetical protein